MNETGNYCFMVLWQYQAQADPNKSENEEIIYYKTLLTLKNLIQKKCAVVYEQYIRIWQEQIAFPYSTVKNNDGDQLI